MFLVTCAFGKTGLAIVRKLNSKGVSVRAMVKTPESADKIKMLGVSETIVGDLRNSVDVGKALESVSSVYYIAPNMVPEEKEIGENIIENCKKKEVSHFLNTFSRGPEAFLTESRLGAWLMQTTLEDGNDREIDRLSKAWAWKDAHSTSLIGLL